MIDVYAAEGRFPKGSERQLGEKLTAALLRAEGVVDPGPTYLDNTGAFLHLMPAERVQTAASPCAHIVRVQVLTPPGTLTRERQRELVKDVTQIVAEIIGDPTQAARTWVLLTEAAEGGWGLAGYGVW
jgi:phenylpyruvate tautomerase PptA (4-oxalocrotonate tautomerase family)